MPYYDIILCISEIDHLNDELLVKDEVVEEKDLGKFMM